MPLLPPAPPVARRLLHIPRPVTHEPLPWHTHNHAHVCTPPRRVGFHGWHTRALGCRHVCWTHSRARPLPGSPRPSAALSPGLGPRLLPPAANTAVMSRLRAKSTPGVCWGTVGERCLPPPGAWGRPRAGGAAPQPTPSAAHHRGRGPGHPGPPAAARGVMSRARTPGFCERHRRRVLWDREASRPVPQFPLSVACVGGVGVSLAQVGAPSPCAGRGGAGPRLPCPRAEQAGRSWGGWGGAAVSVRPLQLSE